MRCCTAMHRTNSFKRRARQYLRVMKRTRFNTIYDDIQRGCLFVGRRIGIWSIGENVAYDKDKWVATWAYELHHEYNSKLCNSWSKKWRRWKKWDGKVGRYEIAKLWSSGGDNPPRNTRSKG